MRSHHGTISLAPLDRQQVSDMVAELSARHARARDVVEDVAVRTGGVPLFVGELTMGSTWRLSYLILLETCRAIMAVLRGSHAD